MVKLVVIGGQSRNVGKTSLMSSIIRATPEFRWTALKITQYGHGVCSTSGGLCACAVEDPACPYSITRESSSDGDSDTSRFLVAGAAEVYWVRTRQGQLGLAMPELKRMLATREFVIMESNSIVQFLRPDVYLSVLQPEISDFKTSCRLHSDKADGFVIAGSSMSRIDRRPVFTVQPPDYCSTEVLELVLDRLKVASLSCD